MSKLTPEEYANKQATRLKASIEDIRIGINKVTVAPGAQAAANQAKMLANITAAINTGKWGNALRAVSLEEWKTKASSKGVNRISEGIDAAHDKVVAVATKLLPFIDALQATVNKMPDVTIEDAVNKSAAMIRGMHKFVK